MESFFTSVKMHLFLMFSLVTIIASGQETYSDQVVSKDGHDFLPYSRGEVNKHFEGDKAQLMNEIYEKIVSWESLNPPKGFEARFYGSDNGIAITFAAYVKEEDLRTVRSGANLYIDINDPVRLLGSPLVNQIYLEPEIAGDYYGNPIYRNTYGEVTVISKIKNPLFVPVTQEEYLQQLIEVETERQKEYPVVSQEDAMRMILAEMEKAYLELLKADAAAAAEFKAEIVKFKAQMENQVDMDGNPRENNTVDPLAMLKKELENLSPAGRNKPARYALAAMQKYGNYSGLVPENETGEGTALVKVADEFSKLTDENNVIRLLIFRWDIGDNNHTSDMPRLYDGDTTGFGLADYHMKNLYDGQKICLLLRPLL